jgi:hypothetical protein
MTCHHWNLPGGEHHLRRGRLLRRRQGPQKAVSRLPPSTRTSADKANTAAARLATGQTDPPVQSRRPRLQSRLMASPSCHLTIVALRPPMGKATVVEQAQPAARLAPTLCLRPSSVTANVLHQYTAAAALGLAKAPAPPPVPRLRQMPPLYRGVLRLQQWALLHRQPPPFRPQHQSSPDQAAQRLSLPLI